MQTSQEDEGPVTRARLSTRAIGKPPHCNYEPSLADSGAHAEKLPDELGFPRGERFPRWRLCARVRVVTPTGAEATLKTVPPNVTARTRESSDAGFGPYTGVRAGRSRPKVEHRLALDIRRLHDYGLLKPGTEGWVLLRSGAGNRIATANFAVGTATLCLRLDGCSTGRLRITLQIGYAEGPAFEDRGNHPLESGLNRLFITMYRLVLKCWNRDRVNYAAELSAKEAEPIRAEKEKVRAERERKALAERHRRKRLQRDARRWGEARRLGEYVAHVQSVSATPSEEVSISHWADWALAVADATDPTATPRRREESGDRKSESE